MHPPYKNMVLDIFFIFTWTSFQQTVQLSVICDVTALLWRAVMRVVFSFAALATGLLPDTLNCGLRMRRECRERFPRHRLQRKPLVSDPGGHHGTCVTHVPWCMPESLTRSGGENVPGIPGACATRNFTYLVRGPWGVSDISSANAFKLLNSTNWTKGHLHSICNNWSFAQEIEKTWWIF